MSKRREMRHLVRTAAVAALLVVCAWISIPSVVPFTMQTFGVWFAFLFLGAKRGTVAVLLYLVLGLIGLPVYAGGASGAGALFGANGGYMMGWLLAGLVMWLFEKYVIGRLAKLLSMITSLLTCYTTGTAWFMMVYAQNGGLSGILPGSMPGSMPGIRSVLLWCVLPFLIPDAVKLALAWWTDQKLRQIEE